MIPSRAFTHSLTEHAYTPPLFSRHRFKFVPSIRVSTVGGYDHCGSNATKWAAHAGDPNYNLLNECCLAMNGGNPAGLGWTSIR